MEIRTATEEDIIKVSSNIRESDIREAEVFGFGKSAEYWLMDAFRNSEECCSVIENGKPIACFGVRPCSKVFEGDAVVWMTGTPDMELKNKKQFLKLSKYVTNFWAKKYKSIFNIIEADDFKTIKWLEFCGFSKSDMIEYGSKKVKSFIMEKA